MQFFSYVYYRKWDYPSILKADIQAISLQWNSNLKFKFWTGSNKEVSFQCALNFLKSFIWQGQKKVTLIARFFFMYKEWRLVDFDGLGHGTRQLWNIACNMKSVVIWVVKFQRNRYKISEIFSQNSTSLKEIIVFYQYTSGMQQGSKIWGGAHSMYWVGIMCPPWLR